MTRFLLALALGLTAAPAFGQTKEVIKEVNQLLGDLRVDEDTEVMRRLLGKAVFPAAGPTRFTFDALPLPGYGVAFTLKLGHLAPDPGPPAALAEAAETCKKCHEADAAKVLKNVSGPAAGPAAPGAKDEWQQALAELRSGAAGDKPAAKPTAPAVCYPGRVAEAVARALVKHGRNMRLEKGEDRLTAVVFGDQGWPPPHTVRPDQRYRVTYQPRVRVVQQRVNGQEFTVQRHYYTPSYEPTDDPTGTLGADLFQPAGIPPALPPEMPTPAGQGIGDGESGFGTVPPANLLPTQPQQPLPFPVPEQRYPKDANTPPPNIPSPNVPTAPAPTVQPGFTSDEAAQLRLGELHLRQNNAGAAVQALKKATARFADGKVRVPPGTPPGEFHTYGTAAADALKKLAQAHLVSGDLEAAKKAIDAAAKVSVEVLDKPADARPTGAKLIVSVKRSDLEAAGDNPAEMRKRMTIELRKGRPVSADEGMPAAVTPPPTVPGVSY